MLLEETIPTTSTSSLGSATSNQQAANNDNDDSSLASLINPSTPSSKGTSNSNSNSKSPMDRFPLRSLDANSSHSLGHSTPGGAACTPLSSRSKASSSRSRAMDADYDYTNRYIVSLNDDDDDEHEHEHEHEHMIYEENDCSTIGHSTVTSINTSANRQLDYDSVIGSGYAGSVSAAPSDLSGGFSIDNDNFNDHVNDLQVRVAPSRRSRGANNRNRNYIGTNDRHLHRGLGLGLGLGEEDCVTNCTQTVCSANNMSFSAQMKKLRERRRRVRAQTQKAHKESMLSEFRAFLSRNTQRPGDLKVQDPLGGNDVGAGIPVGVPVGEDLEYEPEGHVELQLPSFKQDRDRSISQDFTPTELHGEVPWIVFQNDRDEDCSTINGGEGSRCGGFTETKDVESAWDQFHNEDNANTDADGDGLKQNGNDKDRTELIYIVLIAASITTLSAVVAVVAVYS